MRWFSSITCAILVIALHLAAGQLPPRLNIPGAVLVGKPAPFRQRGDAGPPPRLRRPIPIPPPVSIRPVVEEPEEGPPSNNNFDDEVSKLGISALQTAVRQAVVPEEEEENLPRPVQFRPERPVPVLRQDVRENNGPPPRPLPVLRQEQRETVARPIPRQELRDDLPIPVRQPARHSAPRQQVQPQQLPPVFRQPARQPQIARQPAQHLDDEDGDRHGRTRKPPVQILRKYRTDNADGSITWGYENEDGSFKEETLGVDCVTKGKYGYVDPDGVRREYSYETGNKCDEPEEEEELTLPGKQLQLQPQPQARKPQFRPGPVQYQQ